MDASAPDGRTGPVAITGSTGQVGQALQRRLRELPNPVVPLDRSSEVAAALADVEVVVHLAGTLQPCRPNTYAAANLDTARTTAAAVSGSAVERIVFLSFLTADRGRPTPTCVTRPRPRRCSRPPACPRWCSAPATSTGHRPHPARPPRRSLPGEVGCRSSGPEPSASARSSSTTRTNPATSPGRRRWRRRTSSRGGSRR